MSNSLRLVVLSFLMLFVELALIRWLGSHVVYLSYFSNFVLLGSFLGIGVGFLRGKLKADLFPWAGTALAFLIVFVLVFPVTINRSGSELVYFGGLAKGLPMWVILPAIFLLVGVVMAAIAQGVARTFALFEPLEAYRLDILGSLAGITAFTVLSFLGAPPVVWGIVATVALAVLYGKSLRAVQAAALAGIVLLLWQDTRTPDQTWSPYYKISLFAPRAGVKVLMVNNVPHQVIESMARRKRTEPVYFYPYRRIQSNPLNNVLIVGAGNGGDVAIALAAGAKHVDAVEIDPRIYQIGRQLNPDRPYENPRVTVHINDGRAFLQQTRSRYDLILFALPDSLMLVSGQSSLRLESYLFTSDAMRAARAHLTPGGAFGMYNFYRESWLIDRLANTLESTYRYAPCIDTFGAYDRFALLMAAPDPRKIRCSQTWAPSAGSRSASVSDDYPFPYLRSHSIPSLYLITIAGVLLASLLLIRGAAGPLVQMTAYLDLFFMGAAFLLLETKNVVQFALLFGTTWVVNALVFFGILLSVFAAVEVARRVRVQNAALLYASLLLALLLAWSVPSETLLSLGLPLRFIAAVSLAFAPVFLANLVFAERFRDVGSSTVAFGANLLGAMVGGLLEYSSLLLGYRDLLIVIAVLYGLAFLLGRRYLALAGAVA